MFEFVPIIHQWHQMGKEIALATIIKVQGSSLRPAGSKMLISSQGDFAGSVSGGCVDAALIEEALLVIQKKVPKRVIYGVNDQDAWEVGLSCGGTLEIWVEPFTMENPLFTAFLSAVQNAQSGVRILCIDEFEIPTQFLLESNGNLQRSGNQPLPDDVLLAALRQMNKQEPGIMIWEKENHRREYFLDVFSPPNRLIIIGAVHMAIPLISLAKTLSFHTTLIDARSGFARTERFLNVDELIIDWPADVLTKTSINESTYLVFISHDEKQDIPALMVALNSPAKYIGVLGSKKTHAKRVMDLKSLGAAEEQIARLHAPIGLNLGARGVEEIALAIMAEMIAFRHGIQFS